MTNTFSEKNSVLDRQFLCMTPSSICSLEIQVKMVCPCIIKRDLGHGAFEVQSPSEGTFKVNGQRLKHYVVGERMDTEETEDDEPEDAPNASTEVENQ